VSSVYAQDTLLRQTYVHSDTPFDIFRVHHMSPDDILRLLHPSVLSAAMCTIANPADLIERDSIIKLFPGLLPKDKIEEDMETSASAQQTVMGLFDVIGPAVDRLASKDRLGAYQRLIMFLEEEQAAEEQQLLWENEQRRRYLRVGEHGHLKPMSLSHSSSAESLADAADQVALYTPRTEEKGALLIKHSYQEENEHVASFL